MKIGNKTNLKLIILFKDTCGVSLQNFELLPGEMKNYKLEQQTINVYVIENEAPALAAASLLATTLKAASLLATPLWQGAVPSDMSLNVVADGVTDSSGEYIPNKIINTRCSEVALCSGKTIAIVIVLFLIFILLCFLFKKYLKKLLFF